VSHIVGRNSGPEICADNLKLDLLILKQTLFVDPGKAHVFALFFYADNGDPQKDIAAY